MNIKQTWQWWAT